MCTPNIRSPASMIDNAHINNVLDEEPVNGNDEPEFGETLVCCCTVVPKTETLGCVLGVAIVVA